MIMFVFTSLSIIPAWLVEPSASLTVIGSFTFFFFILKVATNFSSMNDFSAPESTSALMTMTSLFVIIVIGIRKFVVDFEETWDAARDHSSLGPEPTHFLTLVHFLVGLFSKMMD